MKVLVVDDEEASRYLLESILRSQGYEIASAVDGLDGLERVREFAPDLVVTDILMPRMDGYKMCVRLRSDPETRDIPIMVYTASFGDAADKRFALSIGVDTFLIKPQEPDVIIAEVARLLGAARVAAEHETVEPEDSAMLREYGERISNKLYEKLLELETANEELHATARRLRDESNAKTLLVQELSSAVAKEQEAEEALLVSQERYAAAVRGANDGIWDWDLDSGSFFASPRFRALLGLRDDEPLIRVGQWIDRVVPEDAERLDLEIDLHKRGLTPHFESEYRVLDAHGGTAWMLSRGQALRRDDGTPYRMAGSLTDVTDRKRQEEQLLRNALYDELTGLPNRNLFLDRLRFYHRLRDRREGYAFSVLYVDLDRFKTVNESFGHGAGDALLMTAGTRLGAIVSQGDTVARFSGDEFAILLDDLDDPADAERLAEQVVAAFEKPFDAGGQQVFVTASVGIAMSGHADQGAEELLRDAETAMFRAKEAGRSRYEVFDTLMHAEAVKALRTEAELRRALERGELEPYYQAVTSLTTGEIIGCEALVRWNHPERGLLGPYEFVPVAEDTGLVVPMGRVVMEAACHRAKTWQDAGRALRVSVNISARQFAQPGLLDTVRDVLRETGLSPDRLVLELTESVVMSDPKEAAVVLARLNELGVGLSVDDFGTGYSSLSYLRRFPFDTLKIDRSFVMDIPNDPDNMTIVEAVVGLAHSLKMKVTAEGVETEEQCRYLRDLGCDEIQGFLVSRPVPAAEFEALAARGVVLPE
ncbi:MAG: EAL domain-containing protein [Coriobacteriia bacterium]|nr:EAL domain-containing protein [Coriobacteriia bacterium]